jgi:hypothetical protein
MNKEYFTIKKEFTTEYIPFSNILAVWKSNDSNIHYIDIKGTNRSEKVSDEDARSFLMYYIKERS